MQSCRIILFVYYIIHNFLGSIMMMASSTSYISLISVSYLILLLNSSAVCFQHQQISFRRSPFSVGLSFRVLGINKFTRLQSSVADNNVGEETVTTTNLSGPWVLLVVCYIVDVSFSIYVWYISYKHIAHMMCSFFVHTLPPLGLP